MNNWVLLRQFLPKARQTVIQHPFKCRHRGTPAKFNKVIEKIKMSSHGNPAASYEPLVNDGKRSGRRDVEENVWGFAWRRRRAAKRTWKRRQNGVGVLNWTGMLVEGAGTKGWSQGHGDDAYRVVSKFVSFKLSKFVSDLKDIQL